MITPRPLSPYADVLGNVMNTQSVSASQNEQTQRGHRGISGTGIHSVFVIDFTGKRNI